MLTGNVRPFWRRETVLSLHDIAQHHHLLAMPERRTTDQQCEHYHATCPTAENQSTSIIIYDMLKSSYSLHIHLARVPWRLLPHATLQRLRCQIARRSAQVEQLQVVQQHFGEAKVGDLHIETVVQQNVLRLQIAMDDVVRVDVVDALEHLPHDVSRFLLGQRDDRGEVVEQFAVAAQLEHEKDEGVGLEDVLQFDCNETYDL